MEHLHGLGLIALAAREERAELCTGLRLVCGRAGSVETLRASLCRNDGGQISKLPGQQRDQLIAGLSGLEDACSRLARGDETIGFAARDVERLHNAGLNPERVLMPCERILPARLCIVEELLGGCRT